MTKGGILVLAEHMREELSDITLELLACGRKLAASTGWPLQCVVLASRSEPFAGLPLAADRVLIVKDEALSGYNPEAYEKALIPLLRELSPRLVLAGNTPLGSDLAMALSLALGAPLVSSCTAIEIKEDRVIATSQLCGGKLRAISELPPGLGFALLMPGSYPKDEGMARGRPEVEIRQPPEPLRGLRITFREYVAPEKADVDITKVPVLVAAGRGVQSAENLPLLKELADLLGGALCGSRPVVDQGWLPRSRQVGRSGMTVRPRLYLALGISGAPEHVEGMKDSELIVAVNTDPSAPIFGVAHYGSTEDLLEVVPALLRRIKSLRGG